jgi:hypothetical protein
LYLNSFSEFSKLFILLITALILAISSSGVNGFSKKSSAQRFNPITLFSLSSSQEIIITGVLSAFICLIFSSSSNPNQSPKNKSIIYKSTFPTEEARRDLTSLKTKTLNHIDLSFLATFSENIFSSSTKTIFILIFINYLLLL